MIMSLNYVFLVFNGVLRTKRPAFGAILLLLFCSTNLAAKTTTYPIDDSSTRGMNNGTFFVESGPPGQASLLSPAGNGGSSPTYTWNAVTGSTWYYLWVNGTSGNLIKQWYSASQVGCPGGSGTCSIQRSTAMSGSATWWIRTWNTSGNGPWSASKTFNINPPAAATLISPDGAITTATPTYTWNAVNGSTWYYLWVDGTSGNLIKRWYSASQVGCSGGSGTCSIKHSTAIRNHSATWRIQTWNTSGPGPWSASKTFDINPPAAATLISPDGAIATTKPTYTWNAVDGSTWYFLWVDGTSTNLIKKWYSASQVGCSGGSGTCSIKHSTAIPGPGSATWRIQTWNASGPGPWSASKTFDINPPAAATLISPDGANATSNPTYTWNAVNGATWYYLWVDGTSGNLIKQWYAAHQTGCVTGSGTCSVRPTTAISGSATWRIQTFSTIGFGPWSAEKTFQP